MAHMGAAERGEIPYHIIISLNLIFEVLNKIKNLVTQEDYISLKSLIPMIRGFTYE